MIKLSDQELKEALLWRESKYFNSEPEWCWQALFKMSNDIPNVTILNWAEWFEANKDKYPQSIIAFLRKENEGVF